MALNTELLFQIEQLEREVELLSKVAKSKPVSTQASLDESEQEVEQDCITPENNEHTEKLNALGLKYGCAFVYKVGDRFYGWGDFGHHSSKEDIEHNLRVLKRMLIEKDLHWIGKAYDSDMYYGTRKLTEAEWQRTQREIKEIYREQLKDLGGVRELTAFENKGQEA
jgi:hypothetical protein